MRKAISGLGPGQSGGAIVGTMIAPGVGTLIGGLWAKSGGAIIENQAKAGMTKEELLKTLDDMEKEELAVIAKSGDKKVQALKDVNEKSIEKAEEAAKVAKEALEALIEWKKLSEAQRKQLGMGLVGGGLILGEIESRKPPPRRFDLEEAAKHAAKKAIDLADEIKGGFSVGRGQFEFGEKAGMRTLIDENKEQNKKLEDA